METIQQLKNELKKAKKEAFHNAKTEREVIDIWNEDKRSKIPKECKRFFCCGCRQDFYNRGGGGAKECWSLGRAKLKLRKISRSLSSVKPDEVITLNCYIQEYR